MERLRDGDLSSRIAGSLSGDLNGNVLNDISGSVAGELKQLSLYLNEQFSTSYGMSTPFVLQLGASAAPGGSGALQFETDGAGSGQYTGGYMDFALFVDNEATSLLSGTLFFKPQAEMGSATLSPNRGTSDEFTLLGMNWMHDGDPVNGGVEPDWTSFLSGLGYDGPQVLRTPSGDAQGIAATLGVDLYVVRQGGPNTLQNPEPAALVIWGLLAGAPGVICIYRRRSSATDVATADR